MLGQKFPHYRQLDEMDCGPTCLRIISRFYKHNISLQKLRSLCETTRLGTSLKSLSDAAEKIGFRTLGVTINFDKLKKEAPLPCIVHWNQNHFVVLYKFLKDKVCISDPAHGLIEYNFEEFVRNWTGNGTATTDNGITLLFEPTPKLKEKECEDINNSKGFSFIYKYLFRYKKFLIQLLIGLFAGSVLQLIFPFLTQSVVDIGIQNSDLNFIYLILIAQLLLFIGRTSIELIRSWILLHLGMRINISIISDFFIKLMNLPISFFDTKLTGDIMQRINDHHRIKNLLTNTTLNILFSLINLIVFGGVLAWYNYKIFLVFIICSILYFVWIILFLKKRKEIDYKRFEQMSAEQSKVIELINGMQEIKLHNAEKQKRWDWEHLKVRLYKIEIKSLSLEQFQTIGSGFINEIKNIIISFLSAKLVLSGNITLGMMMSINYIIGQLNSPVQQFLGFIHTIQDAGIALERLSEIHHKEEEEPAKAVKINNISLDGDIVMNNIDFRYIGGKDKVISNLNLVIPRNKITAIVGASGSGKTTLMKLLLRFYEPGKGEIKIMNTQLSNISQTLWRRHCGIVMQEGYIFNETITENITLGDDYINQELLIKASKIANITDFVEKLPMGYNTKIGIEGLGISTGQKQRILIARAVYKDPSFIFFDEATSALDARNERLIMENLKNFFESRTVIIIAHRLSTVRNADQIIVLDKGNIIEKGTHAELVDLKGIYFNLVKNQLELENINAGY
ncbi:MAG: peptidase domain-containing ABC transporter [Bacteroidales bacterium]|nr:peptidase domain-containing ABC transporter [Bacteroidales bacterium]